MRFLFVCDKLITFILNDISELSTLGHKVSIFAIRPDRSIYEKIVYPYLIEHDLEKRFITEIHTMKEQLRLYWEQDNQKKGGLFLTQWLLDAMHSDVKQLRQIAYILTYHLLGMIHYYPHKITNGLLEGLNNKVKTMKRQAYGFRDMEYFTLRLYDLHTSRYAFSL